MRSTRTPRPAPLVGITALASDADATNNTVTYSLIDNAGGAVPDRRQHRRRDVRRRRSTARAIGPASTSRCGDLRSDGSTAAQTFTIAVNDVDEFDVTTPVDNDAARPMRSTRTPPPAPLVGITALATDADATNNTVTYSLIDNAGGAVRRSTPTPAW